VWRKAIKHAISMFYTVIKHGFLTNESVRQVPSIIIIIMSYTLDSNLTIIFFQWVVLSIHWTTPASKFLESVIDLTQMQLCATYNFLGAVNSIRVYHEQTLVNHENGTFLSPTYFWNSSFAVFIQSFLYVYELLLFNLPPTLTQNHSLFRDVQKYKQLLCTLNVGKCHEVFP